MSAAQTVPSADIQRLVDEGYAVTLQDGYLIIDNVPYVPARQTTSRAALISQCNLVDGRPSVGGDHTVWFTGSVPCLPDGTSLQHVLVANVSNQTIAGRAVQCQLSNKPENVAEMLENFYNKLMHYIRKLESYAQAVDPTVTASSIGSLTVRQQPSIFYYPNTAITKAGLDAYDSKLKLSKVAIVGLGGTGSYILDALAKTPVSEILLFDDDVIDQATGFRFPGAVPIQFINAEVKKTDYLAELYQSMRVGVCSRPVRISDSNVDILHDCDFVFIAVDHGPSRGVIARSLAGVGVPFIDVGIGVDKVDETTSLIGRARVTLITPETASQVHSLPTADDTEDLVYSNIQVVELNAINAMLAMVMYKQWLTFYVDEHQVKSLKYITAWSELHATRREAAKDQEDPS